MRGRLMGHGLNEANRTRKAGYEYGGKYYGPGNSYYMIVTNHNRLNKRISHKKKRRLFKIEIHRILNK
jgi:hypothetical protein